MAFHVHCEICGDSHTEGEPCPRWVGLWRREHGEHFAVPGWAQRHFIDLSYHNDACPHFAARLGTGHWLHLWIDHVRPEQRDEMHASRFAFFVSTKVDEDGGSDYWLAAFDGELRAVDLLRALGVIPSTYALES